jgi:flagellar protein FlgJ
MGAGGLEKLQLIAERSKSGKELSDKELKEVGQQFEALLLHQLLSAMRKTIPKNELFEKSSSDDTYKDLFDEKMADQIASSGQTGISDAIVEAIKAQQQKVTPPAQGSGMIPLIKKLEAPFRPIEKGAPLRPIVSPGSAPFHPIERSQSEFRPLQRKRA